MKLYEIEQEILNCVDEETGEIIDFDKFEKLQMEREEKIEKIGLWYKNLLSDAQALKNEIDTLTERKKKTESKAEQIKSWLGFILKGNKFETSKLLMFWKKSKSVEVDDDFVTWAKENRDDLLTYKEPTPDKKAIKEALKSDENVHASLVEHNNLTIK